MANYNFYSEYLAPTQLLDNSLEDVLRLYQMVESKNKQLETDQKGDADEWGKSSETFSIERGKLNKYLDNSPTLKARLEMLDAKDLAATQYAYLNLGNLSAQDRQRLWNYRNQRAAEISELTTRLNLYEEDMKVRKSMMANKLGDSMPIFKRESISPEDYVNDNIDDAVTSVTADGIYKRAEEGTRALLASVGTITQLEKGYLNNSIIRKVTSGDYNAADVMKNAMERKNSADLAIVDDLGKNVMNYINSLRMDLGYYDGYSEKARRAIDHAIFRGVWAGLTPKKEAFQNNPSYVKPTAEMVYENYDNDGGRAGLTTELAVLEVIKLEGSDNKQPSNNSSSLGTQNPPPPRTWNDDDMSASVYDGALWLPGQPKRWRNFRVNETTNRWVRSK